MLLKGNLKFKNVLIVGLLSSLILIMYIPPAVDFSVSNPFWNGYSEFQKKFNVQIIDSPIKKLNYDPSTTVFIIIPYIQPDKFELDAIIEYLTLGGTVIIMDDFKYGNIILKLLKRGISIRNDSLLVDPIFHYKSSRLPRIFDFERCDVTEGIGEIYLNYASTLTVESADIQILAYSSSFSYLDFNLNGVLDGDEPTGPFPVIARFPYGRGQVYVISDPSIIINSMINMGDNAKLIKNIVGNKTVIIDQYHLVGNIHYTFRTKIFSFINYISSPTIYPYITILISFIIILVLIKSFRLGG